MIIGVPKESFPGERRVALVPTALPQLKKAGVEVLVEAGAGEAAFCPDAAYVARGAQIAPSRAEVFKSADVLFQVLGHGANDRTGRADLELLRPGQALIAFLRPLGAPETVREIAATGATAFAVEFMPRITRAQSMDALSSMATVAGFKAVLDPVVEERKREVLHGAVDPQRDPAQLDREQVLVQAVDAVLEDVTPTPGHGRLGRLLATRARLGQSRGQPIDSCHQEGPGANCGIDDLETQDGSLLGPRIVAGLPEPLVEEAVQGDL